MKTLEVPLVAKVTYFPPVVRIPNGPVPSLQKWQGFGDCYESESWVWKHRQPPGPHLPAPAHLSDHREAHDEETNAAAQSEDRLVCAQVLGELVRDGGHYGFDGGKLEGCREKGVGETTQPQRLPKPSAPPTGAGASASGVVSRAASPCRV